MNAHQNTKLAAHPIRAMAEAPRMFPASRVGAGTRPQASAGRTAVRRLIAGVLSGWLAVSPLITLRAAYAGPV
ncbi:MAG: hypothetical protein WHV61_11785, partial [Burkholderiales bacterium]